MYQDQNRQVPATGKAASRDVLVEAATEPKSRYAVTVRESLENVYTFFRKFENFPLFMKDVEEVTELSGNRTHWVVQLKTGPKAEWDAEIVQDLPNELISWRSVEDSEVDTFGEVKFHRDPGGKGTVVSLTMDYKVPGGKLTEFLTMFTGEDPDSLAKINLRRLKALLETGEIPTIEGQPSGREEEGVMQ